MCHSIHATQQLHDLIITSTPQRIRCQLLLIKCEFLTELRVVNLNKAIEIRNKVISHTIIFECFKSGLFYNLVFKL